mgnify:CR=1 FL=1
MKHDAFIPHSPRAVACMKGYVETLWVQHVGYNMLHSFSASWCWYEGVMEHPVSCVLHSFICMHVACMKRQCHTIGCVLHDVTVVCHADNKQLASHIV